MGILALVTCYLTLFTALSTSSETLAVYGNSTGLIPILIIWTDFLDNAE